MNEELKRLIDLLDGAGYEIFGVDIDGSVKFGKDGISCDIVRVRLGIPEPTKTITREEFDKLSIEQRSEFMAERGRIT
jgi:hypothetical protein